MIQKLGSHALGIRLLNKARTILNVSQIVSRLKASKKFLNSCDIFRLQPTPSCLALLLTMPKSAECVCF